MHRSKKRLFALAWISLSFAPLTASAGGDLQVALSANRVVTDAGGKESLAPAESAKPGEVIEYRAVYHNSATHSVRQVEATLPIPAGVAYLPRTAQPLRVDASLDGKTYAQVPLTRRVRLADGREVVREVPTSEYRFLRWTLGEIPARGDKSVRARVSVASVAATSTTAQR